MGALWWKSPYGDGKLWKIQCVYTGPEGRAAPDIVTHLGVYHQSFAEVELEVDSWVMLRCVCVYVSLCA